MLPETVAKRNNIVRAPELYLDMYNYCGERCEVKLEAINLRERKIIPAIKRRNRNPRFLSCYNSHT